MTRKPIRQPELTYIDPIYKYPCVLFGILISKFMSLLPWEISYPSLRILHVIEVVGKEATNQIFYGKKRDKYTTSKVMKQLSEILQKRIKRKKTALIRLLQIKIERTKNKVKNLLKKTYTMFPAKSRWKIAQNKYVKWAEQELPPNYIEFIQKTSKAFADFVGNPGMCLDVGCGNGLLGGISYEEIGYTCLNNDGKGFVVGIDPLPLKGPIPPWINEYVMAVGEFLPFRNVFKKATIVTSLGHLFNTKKSLRELSSIQNLYIRTIIYKKNTPGDIYHIRHFTFEQLSDLLSSVGFHIIRKTIVKEITDASDVFLEMRRITQ